MPDDDKKPAIIEYTTVENGQFFSRKVTVDEAGTEEIQYVMAQPVYASEFTVRQGPRRNRFGELVGPKITGGGNGDVIVMDLVDGELDVIRGSAFPSLFKKVALNKLPKEHAKKYLEEPTAAEA